jgi:hypothetical protein
MMLPCSGLLVLCFFCKHELGNDCNYSQMFFPTIGCDIVSNVNDNMGHIMHLQQFTVACEISADIPDQILGNKLVRGRKKEVFYR